MSASQILGQQKAALRKCGIPQRNAKPEVATVGEVAAAAVRKIHAAYGAARLVSTADTSSAALKVPCAFPSD